MGVGSDLVIIAVAVVSSGSAYLNSWRGAKTAADAATKGFKAAEDEADRQRKAISAEAAKEREHSTSEAERVRRHEKAVALATYRQERRAAGYRGAIQWSQGLVQKVAWWLSVLTAAPSLRGSVLAAAPEVSSDSSEVWADMYVFASEPAIEAFRLVVARAPSANSMVDMGLTALQESRPLPPGYEENLAERQAGLLDAIDAMAKLMRSELDTLDGSVEEA